MTERQYVEHIRKMATAYMDSFGPGDLDRASRERWNTVKQNLSPETVVALCDAWLAQEAGKAVSATGVADTSE